MRRVYGLWLHFASAFGYLWLHFATAQGVSMAYPWRVVTVVSAAVFMVSLDLFIVNIAFPDIGRDFHGTDVATLSWVLNAYAIVFATCLVPAGRLADRFGRRRAFLAGLAVFLLGSALCGAAPSTPALVAARVVQAVGAAALVPTSLALILPEFPPAQRPAAIGAWAAVGGIAAAAGPPLGGLLVGVSWRLVFLVNLPVGLLAGAYALRLLRESRDESQKWPDLAGTALLVAAVGALALSLVKAPDWGWTASATLGCFLAAIAGLALFVRRCASHSSPVVDLDMLRVRSFAWACSANLVFAAAFAAMLLSGVLFMTRVWHDSVLTAGLSLAPGPLMAAAFAVLSGRAGNRGGPRWIAAFGCGVFAAGAAWWLWELSAAPAFVHDLLPGRLLPGSGVGLTLAPLGAAVAASLPPVRFATGWGVLSMTRQLGTVLGVAALVAILGSGQTGLAAFDRGYRFLILASLLAGAAAVAFGAVRVPQPAAATARAAEARLAEGTP